VVTFREGNTVIGTSTADASGHWSFTPTLTDGAHTIVATETDTAGNTANATLSFTLDTTIATPTLAADPRHRCSDTDQITNDAALSFSAAAGDVTRSYSVDGGPATTSYSAPTLDGSHTRHGHRHRHCRQQRPAPV